MTVNRPLIQMLRNSLCLLLLLIINNLSASAVEVLRPRGVSLTKKVFYDPNRQFTCLDGSLTIPFHYVNDDYCDCEDGTDEPGTAACPNGVFHCTNAGHKPLNIPSSRVNDGICDCCDSSDEYNSSAGCINHCKELGRKAREEAQMQMEGMMKGFEKKKDLIKAGKELKEERNSKLNELQKEFDSLISVKDEKETVKLNAEELEKVAVDAFKERETERKKLEEELMSDEDKEKEMLAAFEELDTDQNGKLSVEEIKSRWVFDENKDGEVTVDEAKFYLNNKEEMELEEFRTSGWEVMKPQYALQRMFIPPEDQVTTPDPAQVAMREQMKKMTEQLPKVMPKQEEFSEDDEDTDTDTEGDLDEEEDETASVKPPKFPDASRNDPATEVENTQYDESTQQLVDAAETARGEFREAENKVKEVESELEKMKKLLTMDFGPAEEFGSMYQQCLDYSDREYTYTLCLFDRVTQKPKSDGSSINLGTWGTWAGPENDKYSIMKYEHGTGCWNGPSRTTEVRLSCGADNQMLRVFEPERCKYVVEMITPATCLEPSKTTDPHAHEEL